MYSLTFKMQIIMLKQNEARLKYAQALILCEHSVNELMNSV